MKKETYRPLTTYEQNVLLPILMKGLEMKKGNVNAVTNKQIVQSLRKHGVKISRTSVNLLINYIRTNDLMVGLMATSFGYYITNSEKELIEYENGLLSREVALRRVRLCIQRQRRAMFKKILERQTQLF